MARDSYHHGNLRQALVDATVSLIEDKGPMAFTLAEAARQAGIEQPVRRGLGLGPVAAAKLDAEELPHGAHVADHRVAVAQPLQRREAAGGPRGGEVAREVGKSLAVGDDAISCAERASVSQTQQELGTDALRVPLRDHETRHSWQFVRQALLEVGGKGRALYHLCLAP